MKLDKGEVIQWTVQDKSNSDNPICKNGSWERDVVVITDGDSYKIGDEIEFVVKKVHGDHYQALTKDEAPVSKPNYRSRPNIPIHHDGKHGQSVGDTRPESHAMRSIDNRF